MEKGDGSYQDQIRSFEVAGAEGPLLGKDQCPAGVLEALAILVSSPMLLRCRRKRVAKPGGRYDKIITLASGSGGILQHVKAFNWAQERSAGRLDP